MITYPELDRDYRYIEQLGTGSQASVDLYKTRIAPAAAGEGQKPVVSTEKPVSYAVKKYKVA